MPSYLKKYFWDVDFRLINLRSDDEYVSARILEYGDAKAIRWLFGKVERSRLEKIARDSRKLTPRSCNFWSIFFGLDKNKVKCLKKSYQKMRRSHWR
jgi:hypothetical protein